MFAFAALCALLFAGAICFALVFAVGAIVKVAFHAILWPLKLLLLPFLLIAVVIKLALVLALAGIVIAVLVPLAILAVLIAAPFFVVSALT
jgi:hypothetical protein